VQEREEAVDKNARRHIGTQDIGAEQLDDGTLVFKKIDTPAEIQGPQWLGDVDMEDAEKQKNEQEDLHA